jgi:hypothetical protein
MWQLIKKILKVIGYVWAWAFIIFAAYRFFIGES